MELWQNIVYRLARVRAVTNLSGARCFCALCRFDLLCVRGPDSGTFVEVAGRGVEGMNTE